MCSDLAFSERNSATSPAFDILIGVGRRPFGKFGLCTHQTLHWCDIGEYETAFATLVRCCRKACNKQKFNHSSDFPVICFFSSSRTRPKPRLKSVNSTLRQHPHVKNLIKCPNFWHNKPATPNCFAAAAK